MHIPQTILLNYWIIDVFKRLLNIMVKIMYAIFY